MLRPTTPYGQGLAIRYVITPQVWALSGDAVVASFDGRSVDQSATGTEVAFASTVDGDPVRFSITQPVAGGTGLDHARFAAATATVAGAVRQYSCVIGLTSPVSDVFAEPSASFRGASALGTAYLADGNTVRTLALTPSVVSIAVDQAQRSVTLTMRLTAASAGGGAPDLDLGSFTVSAPIDASSTNFTGTLNSSGRNVSGTASGRFFGPRASEIGIAFGVMIAATATAPAMVVSGTAFGIR